MNVRNSGQWTSALKTPQKCSSVLMSHDEILRHCCCNVKSVKGFQDFNGQLEHKVASLAHLYNWENVLLFIYKYGNSIKISHNLCYESDLYTIVHPFRWRHGGKELLNFMLHWKNHMLFRASQIRGERTYINRNVCVHTGVRTVCRQTLVHENIVNTCTACIMGESQHMQ